MSNHTGTRWLSLSLTFLLLANHCLPDRSFKREYELQNIDLIEASFANGKKVSFCTLSEQGFSLIPGAGAVMAARLVSLQSTICPTSCLSEHTLLSVKGVGPKTLQTLSNYVDIAPTCPPQAP